MKFERQPVMHTIPRAVHSGACSVVGEDGKRCPNRAAFLVNVFESKGASGDCRQVVVRVCDSHASSFDKAEAWRIGERARLTKQFRESRKEFVRQMKEQYERERQL